MHKAIPDKISYFALLVELQRRIESGDQPRDADEFTELYLALIDARARAEVDRSEQGSAFC